MATTYEVDWVEIDTVLDDGESVEGYVDLGGRFHFESPEEFNHVDRLTAEELEARVAFEEWETIHLEELGELEEDAQWEELLGTTKENNEWRKVTGSALPQ